MNNPSSYQPLEDPEGMPRTAQFNVVEPAWADLQARDQGIKTRVRKLRVGIRIMAFACSYPPLPPQAASLMEVSW